MRKYWPGVVAVALVASTAVAQQPTQAGAPSTAPTAEISIGTGIENRELVGAAETFALTTGKVFCFSRLMNATGTEIEHVWYKGDTEMARVKLMVNGSPWRTYSSKNIGEDGAGEWRCDVAMGGNVLSSAKFTVQ